MPRIRSVSPSIERWTRTLSQLRSRAARAAGRSTGTHVPADGLLEETLAACDSLVRDLADTELEVQKCRAALEAERQDAQALFEQMPMACISTDTTGLITGANRRGALFLAVSSRHLVGRPLLHFVHDRAAFVALLRSMSDGGNVLHHTLMVRPRERRASSVEVAIVPRAQTTPAEWFWFFTADKSETRAAANEQGAVVPLAGDGNASRSISESPSPHN